MATRSGRRNLLFLAVAYCGVGPNGEGVDQRDTTVRLTFPVKCELGVTCYVSSYFDHDPSDQIRDYSCGFAATDGHAGTDIAIMGFPHMDSGVPVMAALAGVVVDAADGEFDRSRERRPGAPDNFVGIVHSDGTQTGYGHLKKGSVVVTVGQEVSAGETIGMVGSSGDSSGPHLHFTVFHPDWGGAFDPFCGACSCPGRSLWEHQPDYGDRLSPVWAGLVIGLLDPLAIVDRPPVVQDIPRDAEAATAWIGLPGLVSIDSSRWEVGRSSGAVLFEREEDGSRYLTRAGSAFSFPVRGFMPVGVYVARYLLRRNAGSDPMTLVELGFHVR